MKVNNFCDDGELAIYNRISEDIYSISKARKFYMDSLIEYGFAKKQIENCSNYDLVEMLNEIDLYDCGKCFYLVKENITPDELREVVYGYHIK